MKDLVFLSAQPHDPYFVWQIEVQIVNFRKFGLSDKMQVVVWYPDTEVQKAKGQPEEHLNIAQWNILINKYPEVKFFFYKDSILDIGLYIPILRPRILAMHFDAYPELYDKWIFYHDSDIIFNYLPDFQKLTYIPLESYHTDENGNMTMEINRNPKVINWQSDTSGYLDYNYLRSKEIEGKIPEDEAVKELCDIGGISVQIMKDYVGKTGGAQYLLKGIDSAFWKDVERMCMEIRWKFYHGVEGSVNRKYFTSEDAGFQSWCADMWAVNMALWKRGYVTDVTKELDFSWATDSAQTYKEKPIFHNAGALPNDHRLFFKGHWLANSPIGKKHAVSPDTASYFYVQAINDVK